MSGQKVALVVAPAVGSRGDVVEDGRSGGVVTSKPRPQMRQARRVIARPPRFECEGFFDAGEAVEPVAGELLPRGTGWDSSACISA